MSYQLNLEKFVETSLAVRDRTPIDVYFHLVEELGEVSVVINRPEKADEALSGELADVLSCTLDIGMRALGRPLALTPMSVIKLIDNDDSIDVLFLKLSYNVGRLASELSNPSQDDDFELEYLLNTISLYALTIYVKEYGYDYSELQMQLDKKCAKWLVVAGAK